LAPDVNTGHRPYRKHQRMWKTFHVRDDGQRPSVGTLCVPCATQTFFVSM
jgi:hypothetical protein